MPVVAVSVRPSLATPETVGTTVFVRASGATPAAADEAEADATELVAVTWTRSVLPTSVEVAS